MSEARLGEGLAIDADPGWFGDVVDTGPFELTKEHVA